VNYATSNNTAFASIDYTATSGTLNWAAGDATSKTFNVPLTDTHSATGTNKFVNLTLSAPTGATLGGPSTSQIQIQGSGGPGSLLFSPSTYAANEASGPVTITVARSGGTGGAVSVKLHDQRRHRRRRHQLHDRQRHADVAQRRRYG